MALITEGAYEGMATAGLGNDQAPMPMVDWMSSDYSANGNPGHQDPVMDAKEEAAVAAATPEEQQRLVREADMYFL